MWPWRGNTPEYSWRRSHLDDNREARPSHCDTLRIDASHVAGNVSAFTLCALQRANRVRKVRTCTVRQSAEVPASPPGTEGGGLAAQSTPLHHHHHLALHAWGATTAKEITVRPKSRSCICSLSGRQGDRSMTAGPADRHAVATRWPPSLRRHITGSPNATLASARLPDEKKKRGKG